MSQISNKSSVTAVMSNAYMYVNVDLELLGMKFQYIADTFN